MLWELAAGQPLLVLLIIFMITTPMDPHGLYTAVPQERGESVPDDTPIVLQLTQVKDGAPSHADVDFEYVAEAIDTAHDSNVRRVGLIP